MTNEPIDNKDCEFINDLARHYLVSQEGDKEFIVNFDSKVLTESLKGVKLLAIVYERDNKKVIAIGPIFNYQEN